DELEVRVMSQTTQGLAGDNERASVKARWSFGKGDAARIVGASNGVACARIEHVGNDANGALVVKREAACLDLSNGKTLLRKELPAQGAYALRRELVLTNNTLAFARATGDGLDVTTWSVEGGVR